MHPSRLDGGNMARRKPPAHVYSQNVTLKVCTGIDRYQKPSWHDYEISGVNLQATNETRKTATNTEVLLRSIAFFDSLYTSPQLDLSNLKIQSESSGRSLQLIEGSNTFTVMSVDVIDDEYCNFDHFELGLI